ncbi:MAG: aminoacyl-tRNA hydrolase [Candidatus Margulisiibacteriota bacterium]
MRLIIGLGNPGPQYTMTRHNTGFLVLDALVAQYGLHAQKTDFKSILFRGDIEGVDTLVAFPQTYMNLSGAAVSGIVSYYQIPLTEVLVIFDDLDLPFGNLRFRSSGSAGTHNGMKSIVEQMVSTEIPRLRIGIGPKPPEEEASAFVLAPFSLVEKKHLPDICQSAVNEILKWLHSA